MKKLYITLLSIALFAPAISPAQCAGERYFNYVFPASPVLTSNITYGSNLSLTGATQSLELDIYEPNGDTASLRPLVLVAHGGILF